MNSYQWIWQYSRKYKGRVIFATILILVNTALILVNPLLSKTIVDRIIKKGEVDLLMPIIGLMIGVTVVRTIVRYCYQILFERVGQNTLFDLRMDMYQKLQTLDFDFFNHTRVGDIMARMTGDTDAIRHFVSWVTYNIIECVLWFFSAIVVMAVIDWRLMLCLVAVTPLIFVFTMKMSKEAHPVFYQIRESFSRLNSMVEENISGNRVVKAFSQEDHELEKFVTHNEDYKQQNMASAHVSRKYLPWLDGFAGSLGVITIVVGGFLTMTGNMSLGDLVAFNGFLWMLNIPMRMSGWLINDVQRFSASCVKIRQMLNTKSAIPVDPAEKEVAMQGYVTFEDVSFHFSDDPETNILSDISFQAAPGQTIGILGETGAGKTTLVNLIARFYDPTSGVVLIDGKNAKDWPVRKLRENIAMVMQDVFLFSNTIEDNIAFGNPELEGTYIRRIAEIADANGFIEKMPEGYQTVVGERGVGLSGGQKQRISLARALAKDPKILILDDTTSAVDMETESKIQKELGKMTQDKTTFIIAHRISSVRDADLILVMEKGRIVEQGTHQELVSRKGVYNDIYQKQLGDHTSEGGEEHGTE